MNKQANRLIHESSPYLLQHAHNPVDWYPWGEEAFQKARDEDKPILLSIGYAACHWCHVMEKESFENDEVAGLMNANFVNIKVDREERPDVDQVYMLFVQMVTGSGGWPMTVFLTPQGEPFFGGTYFPPDDRYGRPGFKKLIQAIHHYYHNEKDKLQDSLQEINRVFDNLKETRNIGKIPDRAIFDLAVNELANQYEPQFGGIGTAPKFPAVQALHLFLRKYARDRDRRFLDMVTFTLENMGKGGIFDQLGGGFARYSVDAQWLVPHFEKMLYDNAQLPILYLETYLLTGKDFFLKIAMETIDFVLMEFRSEEGGFFSSLDADSEGEEGKYYVWSKYAVLDVLGDEEGEIFCEYFDISHHGNFEKKNILHIKTDIATLAKQFNKAEKDIESVIRRGREVLLKKRQERIRPALDDKIIMSWNALMMSALARVYQVTAKEEYAVALRDNLKFLREKLYQDKQLKHTYKNGLARQEAFLDDYAYLIQSLIDAYETFFNSEDLAWAIELTDYVNKHFWDAQNFGYFYTSDLQEKLYQRLKDEQDQSTPSGCGVMLMNQLRLFFITERQDYWEKSEQIFSIHGQMFSDHPFSYGSFINAFDFYLSKPREILIVSKEPMDNRKLLDALYHRYLPNRVIIKHHAAEKNDLIPASQFLNRNPVDQQTTIYVCHNFSCSLPVTDVQSLNALLE